MNLAKQQLQSKMSKLESRIAVGVVVFLLWFFLTMCWSLVCKDEAVCCILGVITVSAFLGGLWLYASIYEGGN